MSNTNVAAAPAVRREVVPSVAAAAAVLPQRSLRSIVFFLSLPVLAEQLLSYCVGLVDTLLSGRLGAVETSAVGLAAYVSWLGTLLFSLVGTGTTAIVARSWGAGQFAQARRVANQSLTLSLGLGLLFFCAIFPLAPFIAELLEMRGAAGEVAVRYLRIDAIGMIFTSLTLAASAALRGSGDMRTPMLVLGGVNVLNIFCSAALTFGVGPGLVSGLPQLVPAMGVDGIVVGTVIARISGGIFILGALMLPAQQLRVRWRLLQPKLRVTRRILAIGLPAAADGALMWGAHFLFLQVITHLRSGAAGEAIFAAHIVGIRVEALTYLPALAFGAAAATLVGQSLGAHERERAVAVGHEAAWQSAVPALLISVIFLIWAPQIYKVMHSDPAVQRAGIPAMRLLALFQVPLVLQIVYVSALRGAGDTRFPLLMTAIGAVCVRVPLAYLFGIVLDGGLVGAWIGMCGDISVRAMLSVLRFHRRRWLGTAV